MISASELIHPSGFGYNLINESVATPEKPNGVDQLNINMSSIPQPQPHLIPSSSLNTIPPSSPLKNHSLSLPEDIETISSSDNSSTKKTYAHILKTGSPLPESIPRKIFGDNPSTGFGVKKISSRSPNNRPPKLIRKGRVEEEIHNPSIISPVFFGKKKNLQKPRKELIFDETLVVWQKR